MSLHNTMKIKDFNFFFGFRHSFRGPTPLKLKNFDQKLKISSNTQNFEHYSLWESYINTSLHHTMKDNEFKFFIFRHSFRGLTPLKFKNFDQKLKISNNMQNFAQRSSWESLINTSLHHAMKITVFFLNFVTLFVC